MSGGVEDVLIEDLVGTGCMGIDIKVRPCGVEPRGVEPRARSLSGATRSSGRPRGRATACLSCGRNHDMLSMPPAEGARRAGTEGRAPHAKTCAATKSGKGRGGYIRNVTFRNFRQTYGARGLTGCKAFIRLRTLLGASSALCRHNHPARPDRPHPLRGRVLRRHRAERLWRAAAQNKNRTGLAQIVGQL